METAPVVVNLRKEPYDLYIGRCAGRRGVFGNPFVVGVHGSRTAVVQQYESWLRSDADEAEVLRILVRRIPPGTRLGCFCKPLDCHGDVIVKLWKEMRNGKS